MEAKGAVGSLATWASTCQVRIILVSLAHDMGRLNEDPAGEAGFSFSVSMIVVGSPLKLTLYRLP
jgi:hypothetical protein